jgi:hypothetical protein
MNYETLNAMNIIDRTVALLKLADFSGKKWSVPGKNRIYISCGRRDIQMFLDFGDDETGEDGAAFKVFCSTDQHPNWVKSQVAKYRSEYSEVFNVYMIAVYFNKEDCEGEEDDEDIANARAQYLPLIGDHPEFSAITAISATATIEGVA